MTLLVIKNLWSHVVQLLVSNEPDICGWNRVWTNIRYIVYSPTNALFIKLGKV